MPQPHQQPPRPPRRQLPQTSQQPPRRPLPQQHPTPPQHQQPILGHRSQLWQAPAIRQPTLPAPLPGHTHRPQRTPLAPRLSRHAHQRPQLHQRLIELPASARRQQLLRQRPQPSQRGRRADVGPQSKHPRQHPRHIAVHHRRPLIKRNARNRPGRVPPDTRQPHQLRHRRRQGRSRGRCVRHRGGRPPDAPGCRSGAMDAADQDLRGAMQVARARVVTQPLPHLQHPLDRRRRQRRQRRKRRQPAPVILAHRLDPRLLKHHLTDPDTIRVARVAPRQRAPVLAIPAHQRAAKGVDRDRRRG